MGKTMRYEDVAGNERWENFRVIRKRVMRLILLRGMFCNMRTELLAKRCDTFRELGEDTLRACLYLTKQIANFSKNMYIYLVSLQIDTK